MLHSPDWKPQNKMMVSISFEEGKKLSPFRNTIMQIETVFKNDPDHSLDESIGQPRLDPLDHKSLCNPLIFVPY